MDNEMPHNARQIAGIHCISLTYWWRAHTGSTNKMSSKSSTAIGSELGAESRGNRVRVLRIAGDKVVGPG